MKILSQLCTPTSNKRLNELVGFLYFVLACLLLLALASYSPLDPSLNTATAVSAHHPAHNWVGVVGAMASDLLLQTGGVAVFLFPVFLGLLGWRWFRSLRIDAAAAKAMGAAALFLFASALFGLLPWHWHWLRVIPAEGLAGRILADVMVRYLNPSGAYIVCLALIAVGLYLATRFSFGALQLWFQTRFSFLHVVADRYRDWRIARAKAKTQTDLERRRRAKAIVVEAQFVPASERRPAAETGLVRVREDDTPAGSDAPIAPPLVAEREPFASQPRPMTMTGIERTFGEGGLDAASLSAAPEVTARADLERKPKTTLPRMQGGYKLPSTTLLHRPDERNEFDEAELQRLAQVLTGKCAEFDVRGTITQINPGPVVTTFEFKPEAGIKLSRITSLNEDLSLALKAESVLIERMAGKSTVGVQVPNANRETIWLREVIESHEFSDSKSRTTLALGKDINGRIVTAELNTMPHLLIAGSTGSGKSVAINAFIMSVLYKSTPDQVRLILVDPKRLELGNYEGVPHLYTPIITEAKLASNALRNAVREMERRLKLLAAKSVRNIDQYNRLFDEGSTPSLFDDGSEEKPIPYILIIIDELADLMMIDGANVEESITRLAQMARAVGIHLILATQRPSVDVITGLIKANFPARISFRVATKVDSRTILDANGAEQLLGKGDLLYLPSGSSRVQRVHAPFVTEAEIAAVVEFWKAQSTAQYEEKFLEAPVEEKNNGDGSFADSSDNSHSEGEDELYQDAVRVVLEAGKASTSLLQRRLRIGYGRAAHLIDLMEEDGLVGAPDGPKPREVLKRPDWLSEVDEPMR
jgi:S-DNA-T family DNA segregation ATPase FtsK/SpoIIIE